MKKIGFWLLLGMMLATGAQAATSRETMKEVGQKWGSFWAREGDRSGLNNINKTSWGGFFDSMNPVKFLKNQQDAYNSRKGQGAAR